ncbi:MAG: putative glycolipid-binding domain-containing protein, partial [bacterium]|nr:putative glycolipid-binding domain-containing protein [bacterium]
MRYTGAYRIGDFHGGDERFTYRFDAGGISYRATIAQGAGAPTLRLAVDFERDMTMRALEVLCGEGDGRFAVQARLQADGLRVEHSAPGGAASVQVVPFDPRTTEVDWRSPVFNGVTCLRLGLTREGAERSIDVCFFHPETLALARVEQRYRFERIEPVETPAGRFRCARYQYSVPGFSAPFWVNGDGLVVRY